MQTILRNHNELLTRQAAMAASGQASDAVRSERVVAAVAVTLIATSAMVYATFPIFPAVLVAATLHAAASCVLGPAIAAIRRLAQRLRRKINCGAGIDSLTNLTVASLATAPATPTIMSSTPRAFFDREAVFSGRRSASPPPETASP